MQRVAVLLVLVAALVGPARAQGPRLPAVEVRPKAGGPVTITVEVASTPDTRQRGLMFRERLAPSAGMLFVFDEEAVQSFWMKNTRIPLDMLFIGGDGRVRGCVERAEPYTETPRSVPAPVRYVLEVNAGFCARHAVRPGDQVVIRGVPGVPVALGTPR